MHPSYKLELCTQNLEQALKHSTQVDQIEYCSRLDLDGLTPDIDEVLHLRTHTSTTVKVMIRCRGGDFTYDPSELDSMIMTAKSFENIGIKHFVFGALKDQRLDIDTIKTFCNAIPQSQVCIHKAIDESSDILGDLHKLKEIYNVNEILTSGGQATAIQGVDMLRSMIGLAQNHFNIVAAGKITYENIDLCHQLINAPIYHGQRVVML